MSWQERAAVAMSVIPFIVEDIIVIVLGFRALQKRKMVFGVL